MSSFRECESFPRIFVVGLHRLDDEADIKIKWVKAVDLKWDSPKDKDDLRYKDWMRVPIGAP